MTEKNIQTEALFSFGESDLRGLLPYAHEKSYPKGEHIWQEGDDPDTIWLVRSGRVNMTIESAEGATTIVHFYTQGQAFCPAATILRRSYPCSAVAATPLTLLAIPSSRFLELFNRLPQLAKSLLLQMAPQFCQAHCNCAIGNLPVKTRLATLLSRLHRQFQGRQIPFTRQELANMSGTTVETTIRTLSEWERGGVIKSGRGAIHVEKPSALQEALPDMEG